MDRSERPSRGPRRRESPRRAGTVALLLAAVAIGAAIAGMAAGYL